MKLIVTLINLFPIIVFGQILTAQPHDTTTFNKSELHFFRPYKFESSLVPFHILVKDIRTNLVQTYEIRNKGSVDVDVTTIKEIELTVVESNRHYVFGIIARPGDNFYFRVELRRHLPALTRVDEKNGRIEYEQVK